jgi:hypothetical protein
MERISIVSPCVNEELTKKMSGVPFAVTKFFAVGDRLVNYEREHIFAITCPRMEPSPSSGAPRRTLESKQS